MYGDVIKISEVKHGDTIEANRVRYNVISIKPGADGYLLSVKRLSDGVYSNQHSLYLGKEVTLIDRKPPVARLTPAKPRRYFAVDDLTTATPTNIRMTWEAHKSAMNGNRQVIESSYMSTCECCGGMIRVSQQCLWTPGHVIHLTHQECVDEQAAAIRQQAAKQAIQTRRDADAICRRARHFVKVTLGTLAMFPALPPGPLPLDYAELWASGD